MGCASKLQKEYAGGAWFNHKPVNRLGSFVGRANGIERSAAVRARRAKLVNGLSRADILRIFFSWLGELRAKNSGGRADVYSESRVAVTTGSCRIASPRQANTGLGGGPRCARLGPFGFVQGRLARAPIPTRESYSNAERALMVSSPTIRAAPTGTYFGNLS